MTHSRSIQVAIAAPALPIRLGLRALVQEAGGFTIQAEAASLAEIEFSVDLEVVLTTENPLQMERIWPAGESAPALLLLTSDPESARLLVNWEAGTWGVLPLDTTPSEIAAAIQALAIGLWVGDPTLAQHLFTSRAASLPSDLTKEESLTSREMEVLQGLSQGLANKQIGLALGISEHTVKFHVSAIYSKLGASNRTEAVRIGVQRGLVTL
jgi:two-component system, NarL family, response regulator YdfI